MAFSGDFVITKLDRSDFDEWAALFRDYIIFYETSIPEDQYRKTFERIMDPKSDLDALVMRQQEAESGKKSKIIAFAHFFPEQTPWSEKKILLLNGWFSSSPWDAFVRWRIAYYDPSIDLFVDPALRGKGQGRKMIQAVADIAKEMGCLRLQWLTKHDNVNARRLYDTMADSQFVQYRMGM